MNDFRIGFVGFGEVNTPYEMIEAKCAAAKQRLKKRGYALADGGIVTDDEQRQRAAQAIERLESQQFDMLVLCVAGWIPSYAVVRVADRFKHLPMVLWGLCGRREDGRLVTTADQAGTSALRKPMQDLGFRFRYVYDTIDGTDGTDALAAYALAVAASKQMATARVGMMGYRDMNLYGTMFDGVDLKKHIGIEIEFIETLEMVARAEKADTAQTKRYLEKIKSEWTFGAAAEDAVLQKGIQYFLALKDIAEAKGYTAISLIDVDGMKKLLGYPPSLVFMLLANEAGLCSIPENDALGSCTQLITRALTGQAAMYLEFYEYMKDRVLMGVPDFVPSEAVDGPYTVTPTSFGLLDSCILNVSKLKTGPATLARLYPEDGGYGLHVALAEAVTPRAWEEAGWTPPAPQLPGLELVMEERTARFAQAVMSQHYIVSYGDNVAAFREYGALNGIRIFET